MNARTSTALVVLAGALAACSGTTATGLWRDPQGKTGFKKVVVYVAGTEAKVRKPAEDELAKRLGHGAVAAHTIVTDGQEAEREKLRVALAANGVDGVLVVKLLDVGQELQRDTTTTSTTVYGYYGYAATAMYSNRTTDLLTVVRVESRLFDVATEEPVWSMESETYDPATRRDAVEDIADLLVKKLKKDGMLAK